MHGHLKVKSDDDDDDNNNNNNNNKNCVSDIIVWKLGKCTLQITQKQCQDSYGRCSIFQK